MSENLLFVLPSTMEEALWAIPVLMYYLEVRLVTAKELVDPVRHVRLPPRELLGTLVVACELTEIHDIIRSTWNNLEVVEKVTEEIRRKTDIVFELDAENAYDLTKLLQKHIVEGYELQVGCAPSVKLPLVAQRFVEENLGSVLVVGRNRYDELRDWVWAKEAEFLRMGVEAEIEMVKLPDDASFAETVDAVSRASVVVGVRGTGTLLGASFQRVVMELSPDNREHKHWMAKWECPYYQMIYGELADMTAAFVWDRTKRLVERTRKSGEKTWVTSQSPTPKAVGV